MRPHGRSLIAFVGLTLRLLAGTGGFGAIGAVVYLLFTPADEREWLPWRRALSQRKQDAGRLA